MDSLFQDLVQDHNTYASDENELRYKHAAQDVAQAVNPEDEVLTYDALYTDDDVNNARYFGQLASCEGVFNVANHWRSITWRPLPSMLPSVEGARALAIIWFLCSQTMTTWCAVGPPSTAYGYSADAGDAAAGHRLQGVASSALSSSPPASSSFAPSALPSSASTTTASYSTSLPGLQHRHALLRQCGVRDAAVFREAWHGDLAADLVLFLSGFVTVWGLLSQVAGPQGKGGRITRTLCCFAFRRICRIYPLVALAVLVNSAAVPEAFRTAGCRSHWWADLSLTSNLFVGDAAAFAPGDGALCLPASWVLANILQCNLLLAPPVVLIARQITSRAGLRRLVGGIAALTSLLAGLSVAVSVVAGGGADRSGSGRGRGSGSSSGNGSESGSWNGGGNASGTVSFSPPASSSSQLSSSSSPSSFASNISTATQYLSMGTIQTRLCLQAVPFLLGTLLCLAVHDELHGDLTATTGDYSWRRERGPSSTLSVNSESTVTSSSSSGVHSGVLSFSRSPAEDPQLFMLPPGSPQGPTRDDRRWALREAERLRAEEREGPEGRGGQERPHGELSNLAAATSHSARASSAQPQRSKSASTQAYRRPWPGSALDDHSARTMGAGYAPPRQRARGRAAALFCNGTVARVALLILATGGAMVLAYLPLPTDPPFAGGGNGGSGGANGTKGGNNNNNNNNNMKAAALGAVLAVVHRLGFSLCCAVVLGLVLSAGHLGESGDGDADSDTGDDSWRAWRPLRDRNGSPHTTDELAADEATDCNVCGCLPESDGASRVCARILAWPAWRPFSRLALCAFVAGDTVNQLLLRSSGLQLADTLPPSGASDAMLFFRYCAVMFSAQTITFVIATVLFIFIAQPIDTMAKGASVASLS